MAKILVVGSRGNVGSKLAPILLAKNETVKAATSKNGVNSLPGAESVHLDLRDPSTFRNALDGVDRMYIMMPTGQLDIIDSLKSFIGAAAEKKIKVVLHTAMGVESDENIPLRQVEIFLERSGTQFVIFRPNWFMDNFHNYWREGIKNEGSIAVPAAEGKTSFIDTMDIAASAASALITTVFDGRALTLTGPQSLGYDEAAAILSKVTGRSITYKPVSGDELIRSMVKAGAGEDYAKFLAGIFIPVSMGYSAAVTGSVREITGREPRTLEEYAREHVNLWK